MYNLEDALVVAQWLNVFLRKSHILKIACVAQIVNVISWLHTRTDGLLKHPSYYVFKSVSNLARGDALDVSVKAPSLETRLYGVVPVLDVSASYNAETRGAAFVVNRSQTNSVTVEFDWAGDESVAITSVTQIAGNDPKELNTWDEPHRLVATSVAAPSVRGSRHADRAAAVVYSPGHALGLKAVIAFGPPGVSFRTPDGSSDEVIRHVGGGTRTAIGGGTDGPPEHPESH